MHFFLNKSWWSAKYGWMLKPNYNYLPETFQAAWIAYGTKAAKQYKQLLTRKTRWLPNMGRVVHRSIAGEWLPHNPNS